MKKPFFLLLVLAVGCGSAFAQIKHRFLANVENGDSLIYVDQVTPANSWAIDLKPYGKNCDIQLIGLNRVMVSFQGSASDYVGKGGFCIFDLSAKGKLIQNAMGLTPYGHETSCQRLLNGHTRLYRNNWSNKAPDPVGVTCYDIDSAGTAATLKWTWIDDSTKPVVGSRCVRQTVQGTWLFGRTNTDAGYVCEGDSLGKVLKQIKVPGVPGPANSGCVYKAVRLKNGNILTSTGSCGKVIFELSPTGSTVKTYKCTVADSTTILPQFFGFFEILENGHLVICNWRGHSYGDIKKGYTLLELDTNSTVVWKWTDPQNLFSVHKVLVLDSLDPAYMYYDKYGVQTKVTTTSGAFAPTRSIGIRSGGFVSFLAMTGFSSVTLPPQANGLKVYDLLGNMIWEYRSTVAQRPSRVSLPQRLGRQVVEILITK